MELSCGPQQHHVMTQVEWRIDQAEAYALTEERKSGNNTTLINHAFLLKQVQNFIVKVEFYLSLPGHYQPLA